jgi:hypothetical protein
MNKGSGIISVTKENRGGRWTSDIVLDIYSNLLLEIWEVVSALVGEAILELLFNIAIKKIGEKYKFLNLIKVSEDGIIFNELKEDLRNQSATELHKGFQSLINHLFQLFSAIAEGVIGRELFPKVFPKLREAERIISQK